MATQTIRSLWREPRAPNPPGPLPRDWALVGLVAAVAAIETAARANLAWPAVSLVVVVALAFTLPWRRVHPLPMALVAFGTTVTIDLVAIARGVEWEGLGAGVFLLSLPYAIARWGSGREVVAGVAVVAVPVVLTAVRGSPAGDVVGGIVVLLLASAVGLGARYQQVSRSQELDGVRSRERELLARELHDTVAHHVSAIAIRAQAGRVVAGTHPDAAGDALSVIEEEASRTLEEMRSMVGALRNGDPAELAPQRGVADIERLAQASGPGLRVEVELGDGLDDLRAPVDAALYRLAQEAVTNAGRHARHATRVRVEVRGEGDDVRLVVDDDGQGGGPSPGGSGAGFGLVGMAERVKLLGGTFEAGPRPGGGWAVTAVLPRHGATG